MVPRQKHGELRISATRFAMRRAIEAPAQICASGTKNKKVHKNEPM